MGRYGSKDPKLIDSFIELAGAHDNVSLDLSGVELFAKIGEAYQRIGAGKLIWGRRAVRPIPPWWTMLTTG